MKILYFFIGTEAELMKMFRTIQEGQQRGYLCKIISNGQNSIRDSHFLNLIGGKIDIDLTLYKPEEKSAMGYLGWFIRTERLGIKAMKEELTHANKEDVLMLVHGDTLSTLMGARISRKTGIDYVHVESGARSYNWFSPFPEEIDRYFSSKNSRINFCCKKEFAEYAEKAFKGKAVNTIYNTGIETLFYALEHNKINQQQRPMDEKYFLLAIHRQENLMSKKFLQNTVNQVMELSDRLKCLFIYHEQTKNSLEKFGLWERFCSCPGVVVIPRQNYFSFINCVVESEFVIADGCGNQQEFYYLGKPYLIMRTKVEKDSEGIGWNAEYFNNDFTSISRFADVYTQYRQQPVIPQKQPSKIIMDNIDEYFARGEL